MESNKKNIRKLSFNILYDVFFNKKLLNNAIEEVLLNIDKNLMVQEDVAFIKRETTGVIEKIDEIDNIINKFSKVKINKLNTDILVVLRIAVFEMLYMDKVPFYATINESVSIIKHSKSSKLSGYVNAVLRNVVRDLEKKHITMEALEPTKNCYFRIYNDVENEVIDELIKKQIDFVSYKGDLIFKYAKVYKINNYKNILNTDAFKKGYILIEDASSIYFTDKLADIIIDKYLNDKNIDNIKILDTCSAPGGKILGLVDLIKNRFKNIEAIACDISKEKIDKINENINRLKVKNVKTLVNDAEIFNDMYKNMFDIVMCDVPCTGLGVIDKKPDIKLNYSDKKKDSLVKIQKNILNTSKDYVKVNGYLTYSTCTETKEENSENINYFIINNTNFSIVYEKEIHRGDDNNSDGFYICIMKKND